MNQKRTASQTPQEGGSRMLLRGTNEAWEHPSDLIKGAQCCFAGKGDRRLDVRSDKIRWTSLWMGCSLDSRCHHSQLTASGSATGTSFSPRPGQARSSTPSTEPPHRLRTGSPPPLGQSAPLLLQVSASRLRPRRSLLCPLNSADSP